MSPKLPSLNSRELIYVLKKKEFILERQSAVMLYSYMKTGEEQLFQYMVSGI